MNCPNCDDQIGERKVMNPGVKNAVKCGVCPSCGSLIIFTKVGTVRNPDIHEIAGIMNSAVWPDIMAVCDTIAERNQAARN